jgi:hypothetical protein
MKLFEIDVTQIFFYYYILPSIFLEKKIILRPCVCIIGKLNCVNNLTSSALCLFHLDNSIQLPSILNKHPYLMRKILVKWHTIFD